MKPLQPNDYIFREGISPWPIVMHPHDIRELTMYLYGHDEDVMTPTQRREHRRNASRKSRG